MSRYYAEIVGGVVVRVVVCDDPGWLADTLGGTWVETGDPYAEEQTVRYCGPGYGHDATWPTRFAPAWQPWDGTFGPDGHTPYKAGTEVFHNGAIWRSLVGDNVWEPGVANWRNVPLSGSLPAWVQPTGAGDAYALGEQVVHDGVSWTSLIPANTTTPGSDPRWWERDEPLDIDPNAAPPDWVQPTGAHNAYARDAEVTYNGHVWRSTINANVWAPGVFGWTQIS